MKNKWESAWAQIILQQGIKCLDSSMLRSVKASNYATLNGLLYRLLKTSNKFYIWDMKGFFDKYFCAFNIYNAF